MDALSHVLRTTRLTGGVFLHAELSDPWCLAVRVGREACAPFLGHAADVIPYHYVLEGRLRVQVPGQPRVELGPGELALLPRNDYHLLGGDLGLAPVPSDQVVRPPQGGGLFTIDFGGGGPKVRMVCGFLAGDQLDASPVVGALPPVLRLDYRDGPSGAWIRSTLSYAATETAAGRMGSETMFGKISELLFVEAVRRYAEGLPEGETGWLAALRDPHVSRAMACLHARPEENWTVERLGREAGLSRSALAERFRRLLGMPPMQYLAVWRMQAAARELLDPGRSIPEIAERVGYETEAAFARAFKRIMGEPPAAWRRRRL